METLDERYFNVDKDQQKIRRKVEKEKRKKAKQEKENEEERIRAEKAFKIYDKALEKLTSYKESELTLIDTNLYAVTKEKGIVSICKKDFDDEVSDALKNKYYSAIHAVFLEREKKSEKIFVDHFSINRRLKRSYTEVSENAIKILYEFSNGDFKTLYTL